MSKDLKKLITLLITLVLLVAGLWFFNYYNNNKKIELFQIRKNIKSYEKLPLSSEIEKNILNVSSKNSQIESFLFNKDRPVLFIETVEDLASENGINLVVENAESINQDSESGGEIRLIVSATGELLELRNLLEDLENLEKEIKTDSIKFSRVSLDGEIFWRLNFILIGKTK